LAFKVISFRRRIESHDPRKTGYPDKPFHALVAGAIGGYFVWGNYSSINNQILLYISSRVCVGLFKLWTEKKTDKGINEIQESITRNRFDWYPYMSAVVWGTVMYLFEEFPHVLQPSLKASMEEIYRFIL
jgi:peroxisomal membrane protein 4